MDSKDPVETITVTFDFTGLVTQCTNPVVTCIHPTPALDNSSGAMLVGIPQVNGTVIMHRVTGGLAGNTYTLRCVVDDIDGEQFVLSGKLSVKTSDG